MGRLGGKGQGTSAPAVPWLSSALHRVWASPRPPPGRPLPKRWQVSSGAGGGQGGGLGEGDACGSHSAKVNPAELCGALVIAVDVEDCEDGGDVAGLTLGGY